MFGCGHPGLTTISSGKCNGRSVRDSLIDGKITLTGLDQNGLPFKRVAVIKDGEVWDNKLIIAGKTIHHIVYGQYEKRGNDIIHFRKGTGTGKHGKSRHSEKLFGYEGICHSWYNRGRLIRQKFIYDNGVTAYNYNACSDQCTMVKDYYGNAVYEVRGRLEGRRDNALRDGQSVFTGKMDYWFSDAIPFEVKKNGKILYKGEIKARQRIGKWVIGGKKYCYVRGVEIPKKLYDTPPDQLDPLTVLRLSNAQTRMALMEKIGPERIAEIGRVIHKDKEMRLYDIKNYDVRILRVRCPTTKAFYYLRVPKDSQKCEEDRQWTFGVDAGEI